MCLAVPMKIGSIDGDIGTVTIGGAERRIGLTLIESPKVGDYVLVHAGFAIKKMDEQEAKETLDLLNVIASEAKQSR